MSWIRCPRCRTIVDPAWPSCAGCDGPVPAGLGGVPPPVGRQVRRDNTAMKVVLLVFACIGACGVLPFAFGSGVPIGMRIAAFVALFFGAGAAVALSVGQTSKGFETAGKVVLGTFAVLGLLIASLTAVSIALVVLVFLLCATGQIR